MVSETELRGEETFIEQYIWLELAAKRKVRLPMWRLPCTTGGMRRYLKKLGIEVTDYLDYSNEKNLRIFGQNNPTWPLRSWVGLLLEWLEWKDIGPVAIERVYKPRKDRPPRKVKTDE